MIISQKIVICGPTCSGKSALALEIAQKIGAVIINADSQQIYSDLSILSARPTEAEMGIAPHYLYGVLPAEEVCNAGKWLNMARQTIRQIGDKPMIFVGGTGLYFQTLFNGIAEIPEIPTEIREKVRRMELAEIKNALGDEADGNPQRMMRSLEVKLSTGKSIKTWQITQPKHEYTHRDFAILYKNVSRETIYSKINQRFLDQLNNGAIEEVQELMLKNLDFSHPCMKAHGVPEIIKYLKNELTLEEAIKKAQQNVRNYAKRQQTWFKNQLPSHKIIVNSDEEARKMFHVKHFS